eukprot:g10343.t1
MKLCPSAGLLLCFDWVAPVASSLLKLLPAEELEGEQGPISVWPWDNPLINWGHSWLSKRCSQTKNPATTANPGYWFAKFKDGEKRHVSKVLLWNGPTNPEHLNGACLRFTTDAAKPSNADPSQSPCDAFLPAFIGSPGGGRSPTEVKIDRLITGMMFVSHGPSYVMEICGMQIYIDEDPPPTTSTTTTTVLEENRGPEWNAIAIVFSLKNGRG